MYEKQYPQEGIIIFIKKEEPYGFEQAAQLVIEQSLLQFQKKRLMNKIDEALATGNKPLFLELSSEYNKLLEKYSCLHAKHTGELA
jgi:uncharacterized protein YpiB (UPF0302 family)